MSEILNCYINSMIDNIDQNIIPKKINLIIDGGAFNCAFSSGCLNYIKQLEKMNLTKVDKISGCSVGAILGYMYLTDTLDYIPIYYHYMVKASRENQNLKLVHNIIKNHVKTSDYKKINNKLFITYNNIRTLNHTIISEYNSADEVIESLIRTSYIPLIIDGNLEYKNKYCDGLSPFIFNKTDCNTIFISLIKMPLLKYAIYTNNDKDIWNKFFDGLEDINYFFKNNLNKTKYCSLVDKWDAKDFILFRIREIVSIIIVIIIKYKKYFILPKDVLDNWLFKRITNILLSTIKNIVSYNIF